MPPATVETKPSPSPPRKIRADRAKGCHQRRIMGRGESASGAVSKTPVKTSTNPMTATSVANGNSRPRKAPSPEMASPTAPAVGRSEIELDLHGLAVTLDLEVYRTKFEYLVLDQVNEQGGLDGTGRSG